MADEKTPPVEELKWWIDRGPVKERPKETPLGRGIIEKWVYEMLKDYSQDQATRNVVDINQKMVKELTAAPGQWVYFSLGVGSYPASGLAKIKSAVQLPADARALAVDAGYSIRVLITGEPMGDRIVDINFTSAPSLDYWVRNELVEERLFSSVDEALKRIRGLVARYLNPPKPYPD